MEITGDDDKRTFSDVVKEKSFLSGFKRERKKSLGTALQEESV